jgi:hypothetical protein
MEPHDKRQAFCVWISVDYGNFVAFDDGSPFKTPGAHDCVRRIAVLFIVAGTGTREHNKGCQDHGKLLMRL